MEYGPGLVVTTCGSRFSLPALFRARTRSATIGTPSWRRGYLPYNTFAFVLCPPAALAYRTGGERLFQIFVRGHCPVIDCPRPDSVRTFLKIPFSEVRDTDR